MCDEVSKNVQRGIDLLYRIYTHLFYIFRTFLISCIPYNEQIISPSDRDAVDPYKYNVWIRASNSKFNLHPSKNLKRKKVNFFSPIF